MKLILINFFIFSFLVSFFSIPFLILFAKKYRILDVPDGNLKKHSNSVAYLGGIAVLVGLFLPICVSFVLKNYDFVFFFIGLFLLSLLGLIDDIIVISPLKKILGQSFAVIFLVASTQGFSIFSYAFLNTLISFFWILSIINSFNLIDVMDGLTSFVAIFASLFFLFFAIVFNQFFLAIFLASFIGSLVAFCYYNFPPAKIYLGDTGSLLIGGFLGTVPLMLHWQTSTINSFAISFITLLIPILELVSLIFIRLYKKIPFYLGSPDHFSIYLRVKGWSKQGILLYVSCISLFLFLVSNLLLMGYISLVGLFVSMFFLVFMWFYLLFF